MTTETIPATEIIELRELRIGNILSYEGKPVYVTAISLDIDDEYEDSIYFCNLGETSNEKGGWNRAICDKLKRIPLTPELRQNVGLLLSPGYDHIKYLHQLQNLYFALMLEELEIKL